MAKGLFDGLKVIDCASYIAGPLAATVLSDFGADVIKIEPPEGDGYRTLPDLPGAAKAERNYCWEMGSRNKRSVALDLRQDAAIAILHRLVKGADVFISNMPLSARRKLRISAEDLCPLNERLIYASFTAYGEAGPEADKTGFDTTAYWARSGLMDLIRPDASAPPARSVGGMGDAPSGMALYGAIVSALYQRTITGKGCVVKTSLIANGVWTNSLAIQARLFGGNYAPRPPRTHAPNPLANMFQTRDGRWFNLGIMNEAKQYPRLAQAFQNNDLVTDPRFATSEARRHHTAELNATLDALFIQHDLADICRRLDDAGVTFGIVGTLDDMIHDQQMRHAQAIVPHADGSCEIVNSPIQIEGLTKVPPGAAPTIGQHTDEVLKQLGLSDIEITQLRSTRAIV